MNIENEVSALNGTMERIEDILTEILVEIRKYDSRKGDTE